MRNGKLNVYTAMQPGEGAPTKEKKHIRWRILPRPSRGKRRARAKGERLLRNTAVACALLLTVMALGRLNLPWAEKASEGVKSAVTARIDLDETLGQLNFVKNLVPDTVRVFWNMDGTPDMVAPVQGELTHAYDAQQTWQEYACDGARDVRATLAGTVAAVGQAADGAWTVLIDHEDGLQTVYAWLREASVAAGQTAEQGAAIGVADTALYFEMRRDGVSIDPATGLDGV